jgi:hypothetical protein
MVRGTLERVFDPEKLEQVFTSNSHFDDCLSAETEEDS